MSNHPRWSGVTGHTVTGPSSRSDADEYRSRTAAYCSSFVYDRVVGGAGTDSEGHPPRRVFQSIRANKICVLKIVRGENNC